MRIESAFRPLAHEASTRGARARLLESRRGDFREVARSCRQPPASACELKVNVTFFYVGSSLLAPLRNAEREINRAHALDLRIATYNFGAALNEDEWHTVEADLSDADIVFVIHVMDGENAARLLPALEKYRSRHSAVIVINCMP